MKGTLEEVFTVVELAMAAKQLKLHAASKPDGMPTLFYHQFHSMI